MPTPHSFNELYALIKLRKVPFFIAFFMTVLLSYGVLFAIDFIPEPISKDSKQVPILETQKKIEQKEVLVNNVKKADETRVNTIVSLPTSAKPLKIIFDSLDNKEVKVLNPESRDIAVLDTALLSGAVHHPDSADFGNVGNIFILGHSSYLPVVHNKNFQAFNGIQKMTWGDTIRLQSEDMEYLYRVEKVYKAKASEVSVPSTPGKAKLTLATCNSFGAKDDRFVVESVLISSKKL